MAAYFNIPNVMCYSGGTEATAIYKTVLQTLETTGFKLHNLSEGKNPIWAVSFSNDLPPIIAFSKKYSHSYNPAQHFAAVMTCTDADEKCPIVLGADARISLPFVDPKESDGSDIEHDTYFERSEQIATEMYYVFGKISEILVQETHS